MARRNSTRKSQRAKRQPPQEKLSFPGKVARRIKAGIKKLVG